MNENQIGTIIVDCAVELHRDLGPGLLEALNFGEALMREGITRTINGSLDSEPRCLGASVRERYIERYLTSGAFC